MTSRREFLTAAATGAAILRADALARANAAGQHLEHLGGLSDVSRAARDENYWSQIQRCFDVDRSIINLNNGAVSPTPTEAMSALVRDLRFSNASPARGKSSARPSPMESARRDIAREFGCAPEEIAITRNATEAMEALIFGVDLKPGDEVIITDQNFHRMLISWEQRARRDGVVLKKISFPVPFNSPEVFIDRVKEALSPKTRVIEVPHMTNLTGQMLPVRELVKLGRERGVKVFIDGAQSFAHAPSRRDDLDCDYYGASLHKWMMAPVGTGFLYIRKSKIKSIWPLFGAPASLDDDIRKYEVIGTHPAAIPNAISTAVALHRAIGADRKAARLVYLRERWAAPLLDADPRVKIWTARDPGWGFGLALLEIEGVNSGKLAAHLRDKHRIIVKHTKHRQFEGIRVSPSLYSTVDEIDIFVDAMKDVLANGI